MSRFLGNNADDTSRLAGTKVTGKEGKLSGCWFRGANPQAWRRGVRMSPDSRAGSWEQVCSPSQLNYRGKGSVRRSGPRSGGEHSTGCGRPARLPHAPPPPPRLARTGRTARVSLRVPGTAPRPAAQPERRERSNTPGISGSHFHTWKLSQVNILLPKDGADGYGPYSITGEGNPRVTRPSALPDAHAVLPSRALQSSHRTAPRWKLDWTGISAAAWKPPEPCAPTPLPGARASGQSPA